MTIRKGERWGEPGRLPQGAPTASSDHSLRQIVVAAKATGRPVPTVGLLGGDLCRTVGGTGNRSRLDEGGVVLPIDLCRVFLDGEETWFCSHLVARRWLWFGSFAVVMNAQWIGEWDVAPRAHPNDGLADLTEGRLPLGDRGEARRRVRSGTHVPHPSLHTARGAHHTLRFPGGVAVWLDGRRVARRVREIDVEVAPDAFRVVV